MASQRQPVRANPKTPAQIGEDMRQRHYRARVWLNENEYTQFIINVEKTGLSKETYLRQLIMGYKPRELPNLEYFDILRQLTVIGNNMNQIAVNLNSTRHFNSKQYSNLYEEFKSIMLIIQRNIEFSK
ncbi:MAG: plasmid mobilization relaxosome protein MobC [Clostridiaceae bacterium]|nr:plasmid mobilization relaxosome protein MobC [Clostridiaceae bacterium]